MRATSNARPERDRPVGKAGRRSGSRSYEGRPRKTPGTTAVFSHRRGAGIAPAMTGQALLARLYRAALRGADPKVAVRRALERADVARALASARSVGVFAVGKAAGSMARAARWV